MKDLIVQIAVAVIPILGAWVTKVLLANKQALTLVQVLEPLAQAAVTAAEQLGVTQAVTGAVKKSRAVASVETQLKAMGFTKVDQQTIANAVEKAYADLKNTIEATYPKGA
ncbi:phage holin, LL-H family [Lacticaseibacillus paracasei]|uniref:phage holin, LLH family n=1 Tax=Lacticaseibacillus paracasei TaxID=1597 RepID=UPI000FEE0918|nr:phage holin, LLH family [Lacticaseibacillus paracasei]RNE10379.1 phage holin, LL-H family [Lacticaseibacillus paracasei]